jgi:hypothetical protein
MGTMNTTSDLGEPDFEPDLLDAEKTIESLRQERTILRLRASEAETQRDRLDGQVQDIERRFAAFKEAIALVVKELVHD